MTQEDKQLLLKDLCARLPYGVKCRFEITADSYKTIELSREGTNGTLVDFDEIHCYWFNEGFIIPYLRPMTSMTAEEKQSYYKLMDNLHFAEGSFYSPDIKDWLDERFFDYRGLIEKGLALEAPEGIYKTE